jgi:RHS repeat-associated protein
MGYNSADLLTQMVYPDGETLTYSYHSQGALNSVTSNLGTYVYSTGYDAAGRILQRRLGGATNLRVDYTYFDWTTPNGAGRLKGITAGTNDQPTSLLDLRYYTGTDTSKYDPTGNLLNIYDYKLSNPQTQTFTYDSLNRLTSAQASGGTEGVYGAELYTYDALGRLSSKTGVGSYGYPSSGKVHAVTHLNTVQKYWYDNNGNQTKRILGGDTYDLTYDPENRLTQVKKNSVVIATFVYDGDGRRVKQTLGGATTAFVGEYYEAGSSVRKNYHAGGQLVAYRDSTGLKFVFGDHLVSSTRTADISGGSAERQLYKAWGETRSAGTVGTKYQYTGQYSYTIDFGLHFYRSRWFDSYLNRWAQPDDIIPEPGNPADWDRYSYVRNNPVNNTDPSGHCPAPKGGSGNVICVDLFIQSETIVLYIGHGDNRGFDPDSDPGSSRAYAYIYLDDSGNLTGYEVTVNQSCTFMGCDGPAENWNKFSVTQDGDGNINMEWELLNGVSGKLMDMWEATKTPLDPSGNEDFLALSSLLQPINGEMTISKTKNGNYALTNLNRDPYPSLEVYFYDDGQYRYTLGTYSEKYGPFFGPLWGLTPFAKNETISNR